MAFHRLLHFDLVTILGTEEIGTDKKQYDVRHLKLGGEVPRGAFQAHYGGHRRHASMI